MPATARGGDCPCLARRAAGATGATTVAKSYRLLQAISQTATDDELIRRNPCRIKGAGKEEAEERPIATVEQVDAEAMGPSWRLMVCLAAYGILLPEEQAELRRSDVTLPEEPDELKRRRDVPCEPVLLRITRASPELTTGRRATGDPKSRAGKRVVFAVNTASHQRCLLHQKAHPVVVCRNSP